MKKNILFFDLDGTIVDSAPGIKESVKYALSYFGIEENKEEMLNLFIGPPLFDAFSKHYNMDKKDADMAVFKYRENYNGNNAMENFSVYKGIEKTLKELKKQNFVICLATAKPEEYAKKILKKANLLNYFYFAGGASFDETRRTKSSVIKYVIETNDFKKDEILMIGDRENDVSGAKKNEIDILGVTYGYGSRQELEEAGCKNIVSSPEEILSFLIK